MLFCKANPGKFEVGIECQRFFKQFNGRLYVIRRIVFGKSPGLQVQIVGSYIVRGYIGHAGKFGFSECGLQCRGDRLRDLRLNFKQVAGGQFAIVYISPQVFIGIGIDQLHIDAHPFTCALHRSLHDVSNV